MRPYDYRVVVKGGRIAEKLDRYSVPVNHGSH
jgi:hypothetical protein